MKNLKTFDFDRWSPSLAASEAEASTRALESGQLLFFPRLGFGLEADERHLLSPQWSDGKAKNIVYDPQTRQVKHTSAQGADKEALARLMGRFAHSTRCLVDALFPAYGQAIRWGRTSYRPVEADGRASSMKKDDRLLHVDAFASSPCQGERLLRVFSNINPDGKSREWVIGEPFDDVAAKLLPKIPKPLPGSAQLLKALKLTRGLRSEYDHYMLNLHDRGKLDRQYQQSCPKTAVSLPAGSSWLVYTDLVPHAVKSGQYALEQTFYLPVAAMQEPALSPLRKLEGLLGRGLVDERRQSA